MLRFALGKRRQVTIAAGLLCIDGIVLAADTKESYGDTHTYVDKITWSQAEHCSWAIAGSGEGYLLDYMTPSLKELLLEPVDNAEIFEKNLRERMVSLYQSESVKSYPIDKASDLYTQFLIATKFRDEEEPILFIINSTLVTRATQLGTVIGCGPLREFVEEMGVVSPRGVDRARGAALCIVYEAKRRYSDVAGHTQLVSIKNDGKLIVERTEKQSQKEVLLDRVRNMTNMLTVSVLDPSLSPSAFSGLLGRIGGNLKELHKDARKIESDDNTADRRLWRKMLKKGQRQHVKRGRLSTSQRSEPEQ